jgi:UDP-N-acetylmuramoyl-tripeptide--D-alanyl-D-alanine ligase
LSLHRRRLDALLSKGTRRRLASKARFVGITGSSAKSTTTALLGHILEASGRVATQADSNVARALAKTLVNHSRDRDFIVAELGVGAEGTMKPMADVLRPDVAVVTLVALEHRSAFRTLERVAAEKGHLVEAVRPGGFAVLNADDPNVMAMAGRTRERIVTFGRSEGADYRAIRVHAAFPARLSLVVQWTGGSLALQSNFLAEHFWLPVAAATATAIELGVESSLIADRIADFQPILHRFGLISVPGGPDFMVDSIKAPWHSLQLAFDAVANADAPRKRIVLGQISDFAGSNRKYRDAYRAARKAAGEVIFVGEHAHRSEASEQDRRDGTFREFLTPLEAERHIRATAIPGELILLKGSSRLHLERIALSWVEEVRCWQTACGRSQGCKPCGLYPVSYETHHGRKNWKRRARLKLLRSPWKLLRQLLRDKPPAD